MDTLPIIEGYPDDIIARMKQRELNRDKQMPAILNGQALELVFEELRLWDTPVLQVSFKGGDVFLHENIANCAVEWCKYAAISLDFGYDEVLNQYRSWVPEDTSPIRVGFQAAGYWSFVGTDSQDTQICSPGEITLNLEKFDVQLPQNWKTTVLHEFGHALGFYHEHQSPVSRCDFDWKTLYAYLAGPPNFWSKEKVDFNLGKMPAGGLTYSPHDKYSIMHYSFPDWMFLSGKASPCFVDENMDLSTEDIRMAGAAYPALQDDQQQASKRKKQNVEALLEFYGDGSLHNKVLWNTKLSLLQEKILLLEKTSPSELQLRVKKYILIAGGQAAEDPVKLTDGMLLENLLPTQSAYQFLADALDGLVKEFNQTGSVKKLELEICITVKDCVEMITHKV